MLLIVVRAPSQWDKITDIWYNAVLLFVCCFVILRTPKNLFAAVAKYAGGAILRWVPCAQGLVVLAVLTGGGHARVQETCGPSLSGRHRGVR